MSDGGGTSPPTAHLRPGLPGSRGSAPNMSGPVTGRPGIPSPRPSGLNRRAGMGMKLSNVTGIQTPDQQKSSLGGIFGSDFQKWSQIVYPHHNPFSPVFVCVLFCFCGLRTVVDDSDTQNSRLRFSG